MSYLNTNYQFHKGVGTTGKGSSLPLQTVPKSKKTPRNFFEPTLDSLETIGLEQLYRNLEFRDYYAMVEGRLVYTDFMSNEEDFTNLKDIGRLMEEVKLPTYVKHYDILGMIVNQLIGELPTMRDTIRMDSDDVYAQNDYIREKELMMSKYVKETFTNHLNKMLALRGINPVKDDFESEEEQQQYLQYIEQEKAKIKSPQEIEKEMSKSWKLRAVEWAERTYEYDTNRFNMDRMEEKELKDYLLTGRYFTHYHVGYDFYKPERWDPIQTFFSEELDIEYPQDGEYIGRIDFMTASQIIQKYGSKLSKAFQDDIAKVHGDHVLSQGGPYKGGWDKRPVEGVMVPDKDYFERKLLLEYQQAFDNPLGELVQEDADGNEIRTPTWLSDYNRSNSFETHGIAQKIRQDIQVRHDIFRVTEAYWRGYVMYYAIRYEDPDSGMILEQMVSEDLLNDFLKENGISKISTVSLEEFENDPEQINKACVYYQPTVYRGKKISGTSGGKDIYFDYQEQEFQIKGDSEIFDVKLPVAGIVGTSLAQKIRPYQLGYNICLNQITNLLQKELGMFFIMDINLLPSEFKDEGDTRNSIATLRETIQDFGFLPVDMRKQNTQEPGNTSNTFVKQEISFDQQIARRIDLAEHYKRLALEQIGITEQRKGNPNEYMTNEGIKVGQEASYAQTKPIYTEYNSATKKKVELHLTVAQYCVKNDKDISSFYRNSDGNMVYLKFSDPDFHLRKLGVLPVSDAKSKKELENLKGFMFKNNTMGTDLLSFAKITQSDNFSSLITFGKQERARQERLENEKREHEQTLVDKQLKAASAEKQSDREWDEASKERDRANKLEDSRIDALGRASDKNSDLSGIQAINTAADLALKKEKQDGELEIQRDKEINSSGFKAQEIALKARALDNQLKSIQVQEKKINNDRFTSIINKN